MTMIIRFLTVLSATALCGLLLPAAASAGTGSGLILVDESRYSPPSAAVAQCTLESRRRICCIIPHGRHFFTFSGRCRQAGGHVLPSDYCRSDIVCCRTASGPVRLDRHKCGASNTVYWKQCESRRPVCCKRPNGTFASVSPAKCLSFNGRSVDPRFCSEPVCCRTRSGYVTLQAAQCTSAKVQGLPVDPSFCRQAPIPKPICCNYKHRYDMLLPQQCLKFRGTSVDPRFCKKMPGLIRKPGK